MHGLTSIGECQVDSKGAWLKAIAPDPRIALVLSVLHGTWAYVLMDNYIPKNVPAQREKFRQKKADQLRRREERARQFDEVLRQLRQKQEKPVPTLRMGENVNQPPVAVNEMDLVGFKDQKADSEFAGILADNEDWSV
ncbi:hypothetical protein MMC31_006485 [Peltigera leucophlebia]|nr:hypothetical protein [Peltigera leucophlebia]